MLRERNILSPFIVKLNYAFQTNDEMFLVMKYCSGGDLGQYLAKEKSNFISFYKVLFFENIFPYDFAICLNKLTL